MISRSNLGYGMETQSKADQIPKNTALRKFPYIM